MKHRRGGSADPIERYLRQLARWTPRHLRRELVTEARRHLFDATQYGLRLGMITATAQQAALRAFGPAWKIGLAARGWPVGPKAEVISQPGRAPIGLFRAVQRRFFLPARVQVKRRTASPHRPATFAYAIRRQCHASWGGTRQTLRRLTRR